MGIKVTVELTDIEAKDVMQLCSYVGGDPAHSTRKVFDGIAEQLLSQGVSASGNRVDWNTDVFFLTDKENELRRKRGGLNPREARA